MQEVFAVIPDELWEKGVVAVVLFAVLFGLWKIINKIATFFAPQIKEFFTANISLVNSLDKTTKIQADAIKEQTGLIKGLRDSDKIEKNLLEAQTTVLERITERLEKLAAQNHELIREHWNPNSQFATIRLHECAVNACDVLSIMCKEMGVGKEVDAPLAMMRKTLRDHQPEPLPDAEVLDTVFDNKIKVPSSKEKKDG